MSKKEFRNYSITKDGIAQNYKYARTYQNTILYQYILNKFNLRENFCWVRSAAPRKSKYKSVTFSMGSELSLFVKLFVCFSLPMWRKKGLLLVTKQFVCLFNFFFVVNRKILHHSEKNESNVYTGASNLFFHTHKKGYSTKQERLFWKKKSYSTECKGY